MSRRTPIRLDLTPGRLHTLPAQLSVLDRTQLEALLAHERSHQDRFPVVELVTLRIAELHDATGADDN